jgi:hypothetical protein
LTVLAIPAQGKTLHTKPPDLLYQAVDYPFFKGLAPHIQVLRMAHV